MWEGSKDIIIYFSNQNGKNRIVTSFRCLPYPWLPVTSTFPDLSSVEDYVFVIIAVLLVLIFA